jgi:hypothetical protein
MEGTQRQWGNEARRGQAPAMGSNFGEIGPSVAELWASVSRRAWKLVFWLADEMDRGGGGYAAPMWRRVEEGSGPSDGFKFWRNRPVGCGVMGVGVGLRKGVGAAPDFCRKVLSELRPIFYLAFLSGLKIRIVRGFLVSHK